MSELVVPIVFDGRTIGVIDPNTNAKTSSPHIRTLPEFEKLLCNAGFGRVHRSHLVNSQHVTATQKDVVQMNDGSEVKISRRKKVVVENRLNEGSSAKTKFPDLAFYF